MNSLYKIALTQTFLFCFFVVFLLSGFFLPMPVFSSEDANNAIVPPDGMFNNAEPYEKIIIKEDDFSEKKYTIIGEVQVSMTTFHPDYKSETIKKLKMYALSMGADAIIKVTYTKEADFSTTNKLFAKGIAVQFE